jgi:hypothetical protein
MQTGILKIGSQHYRIFVSPEDHPLLEGNYCGRLDEAGLELHVLDKSATESKWVTLWHEVLHGIIAQRNVDLDEGELDALAHGIYEFLDDNPLLYAILDIPGDE